MPTFWTEPVLEDPSLEGLFLDTRPANPNVPFGWEHALSPALISEDDEGTPYAKIEQMQMPASGDDYSVALNGVSVYSRDGLWDAMNAWFDGGDCGADRSHAERFTGRVLHQQRRRHRR